MAIWKFVGHSEGTESLGGDVKSLPVYTRS